MMFDFARRHDAVQFNPVAGAACLTASKRKPKPKALSYDEVGQIRHAARIWRTGKSVSGTRPDGQVRDVIEVLLGTSDRIGEALALRAYDIDDTRTDGSRSLRTRASARTTCCSSPATNTPLSMNNVRRTPRKMLADAGLGHLQISLPSGASLDGSASQEISCRHGK